MINGLPIIQRSPVNTKHRLNQGRLFWWLCLPNRMGSNHWYDLVMGDKGNLTNFTTQAWSGTERQGGFGQLGFTNSAGTFVGGLGTSNSTKFSLFCWVNQTSSSGRVILFGNASVDGLLISATNKVFWQDSGGGTLTGSTTLSFGTWNHVGITYDGAIMNAYVNGKNDGLLSSGSLTGYVSSAMGSNGSSSFALQGFLDDMSLWNRALSANEVFALYMQSKTGYPHTLNRYDTMLYTTIADFAEGVLGTGLISNYAF